MGTLRRPDPWTCEFRQVWRQEKSFLRKYARQPKPGKEQLLGKVVPPKLMNTVHAAFVKAFGVVLEKGDGLLVKMSRQEQRQRAFQVNQFAVELQENKRTLRAFSKEADRAGRGSVLLSGAAGVGMGLFGVALPDVPLFTAMLLKCVYETGESFGFGHETEAERLYVLRVIEAALSYGEELHHRGLVLDSYAQTETWLVSGGLEQQVQLTAKRLSEALVCGKFLQNIPIVGVVGGAEDALLLERVRRYAAIKYRKRYLMQRRLSPRQ